MPTPSLTDRALQDPRGTFETPEAVLRSDRLPAEDKRRILERWRRLSEAPGADEPPGIVTRIMRALAFLDVETGEHKEIEGQGLYGAIGDLGKDSGEKPT